MLSKKAIFYFENGYNCSQSLLKAYADIYSVNIDSQMINSTEAVSNGFGIGSICSVIVAAILILGLHYESSVIKEKRIIFLDKFHNHFSALNCSQIRKYGCDNIITDTANILEELFNECK